MILNMKRVNKMNIKGERKHAAFDMYVFIALAAIELLMSFTFLGYIHIQTISVTFAYIPIMIAGCILTPVHSTVLGFIFGMASMYKASAFYVIPNDMIFSPFLSGAPFYSVILSVGSRTLYGLIQGLLFDAAKKRKKQKIWIGAAAFVSSKLHAVLVFAAIGSFFPENVQSYSAAFFNIQSALVHIMSGTVCTVIAEVLWNLRSSEFLERIKFATDNADKIPYSSTNKKSVFISWLAVFIVTVTVFATLYFSQRTSYMLARHGISVSDTVRSDLIHLQIQFMLATLSLNIIFIIVLIFGHRYTEYQRFTGELDSITGIMGRRLFLSGCRDIQEKTASKTGWFLFLDVDNFKTINDTLGHSAGDETLKSIARVLERTFNEIGTVGRVGGDEFAVFLCKKEISKAELSKVLDGFLDEVAHIETKLPKVSCSIGAYRFEVPTEISSLMNETDRLLYKAKQNGRACYVMNGD